MIVSSKKSVRRLASQRGLTVSSAHKALKTLHLYPYKIRTVHELLPRDHEARVQYCHWFMEMVIPDGEELNDWYWTDETCGHIHQGRHAP